MAAKDTPHKTNKLKLWLGRIVILIILLTITEVILRSMGHKPGFVGAGITEAIVFEEVDTLKMEPFFYTDADGIFKANTSNKQLFLHDTSIHINSEGFRGEEFIPDTDNEESVLLIGDSFTWGATADEMSNSYADLLKGYGYNIYNTGIPCVGPAQYAGVAQKYIPILKPDQVVVCFYIGNDVVKRDIPLAPHANIYHLTNAGWMDAYLDGDHLETMEECYAYFLKRFSIPEEASNFNSVMAKTVITTQIWSIFKRMNWVSYPEHKDVINRKANNPYPELEAPISVRYIQEIKQLCDANQIKFHLCIIPLHTALEDNLELMDPPLAREMDYHWPILNLHDYNDWPDGHFNNTGHKKYAAFLDGILKGS